MSQRYKKNMEDWISESSFKFLPGFVKDAYVIFCRWWEATKEKKWSDIPREVLTAWSLIKNCIISPNFYLDRDEDNTDVIILVPWN